MNLCRLSPLGIVSVISADPQLLQNFKGFPRGFFATLAESALGIKLDAAAVHAENQCER